MTIDPDVVNQWPIDRLMFEHNRLTTEIKELEAQAQRESETEQREYSLTRVETNRTYINARLKSAEMVGDE